LTCVAPAAATRRLKAGEDLAAVLPDSLTFPHFDDGLRQSFRRETELLVESLLREDAGALDLLQANYTFLDERLARHYDVPGVYGSYFRRVPVAEDARRGLLGRRRGWG